MPKIKGNLKVDAPSCGHGGPIQCTFDPKTGHWIGKCAQCGAPAKVEMEITSASRTPQA
jgi:transcription elongation factor Elf1